MRVFLRMVAIILLVGVALPAAAERNLDEGMVLKGFDPVSYFNGAPRMGRRTITTEYDGVTWRFANQENRMRFLAAPEKFEPAFGGHCAWGVVDDDDHEDISPASWKIVDGRLLLFYKGYLGDGLASWNEAAEERGGDSALLREADAAWEKMRQQE